MTDERVGGSHTASLLNCWAQTASAWVSDARPGTRRFVAPFCEPKSVLRR